MNTADRLEDERLADELDKQLAKKEADQAELYHCLESDINEKMWQGDLPSTGMVYIDREESDGLRISLLTGVAALSQLQHFSALGWATLDALRLSSTISAERLKEHLKTMEARVAKKWREGELPDIGKPVDGDGLPFDFDLVYTVEFGDREASVTFIPKYSRFTVQVVYAGDHGPTTVEAWRLHRHPDQSYRSTP